MKKVERPIYRKHNSFVALRGQQEAAEFKAMQRISALQADPRIFDNFSVPYRKILQQIFMDLLGPATNKISVRFALTPSVIDEISTYPDEDLPRYLVHRYRYEVFPQMRILDEYPPYLQIEPSSICNYRCVFCFATDSTFTDKSNGFMGYMPLDLFKKIIDQIEGNIDFISMASRGEPLLCKEIIPMLDYTRGKFLNLKLNTNASLLNEEKCHAILCGGVKTIVFSVDAADEALYSQLRINGRFDVVLRNIERFQKIRQTQYGSLPIISRVSGVKFFENQDINSMQKLWGGLVDQVAFVQYNPWESVYTQPANEMAESCSDLWRRMFVWWDGKANPCDVDYRSTLALGTFPGQTISEMWRSQQYSILRHSHLNASRGRCNPCRSCTVV